MRRNRDDPSLPPAIAEQRIRRALMDLGVTFADAQMLVVYDPSAPTAFWKYDRGTGKEEIHIGPTVAAMSMETIRIVLRHEILHRSLYNGFGEHFTHRLLANLVLDICINRLLFEAFPNDSQRAAAEIYPPEKENNLVSLADCSARGRLGSPELLTLWEEIWSKSSDRKHRAVNPSSLYYRLSSLLPRAGIVIIGSPFGTDEVFTDDRGSYPVPGHVGRAIRAVFGDLRRSLPAGSDLGRRLEKFTVIPARIGTSEIEDFIQRMDVQRVIDAMAEKIRSPLETGVRIQPYPMFPSRLGLVYQLAGVSDVFSLYWNVEKRLVGSRLAIAIYVDVSGSMETFFPLVSAYAAALRDFPLRFKAFDTTVRDVDLDVFAHGTIVGGGGTDFDGPIRDLIEDPEIVAGVLLTDGDGQLSADIMTRFKKSRKKLYVAYVVGRSGRMGSSPLDRCATETVAIAAKR